MQRLSSSQPGLVTRIAGAVAATAALVVGAVLAVVFAASIALIGFMAAVLMSLAYAATKARRPARVRANDGVIEARRVGHSWVAYGYERR